MSAFARAGRRAAIARELAPVVVALVALRARRRVAVHVALALAWLARALVARATARRARDARALRGRAVWITGRVARARRGDGARVRETRGEGGAVGTTRERVCAEVAEECARLGAASAKCVAFDVCGTRRELSDACERALAACGWDGGCVRERRGRVAGVQRAGGRRRRRGQGVVSVERDRGDLADEGSREANGRRERVGERRARSRRRLSACVASRAKFRRRASPCTPRRNRRMLRF